jgi:TatD DNase family protein
MGKKIDYNDELAKLAFTTSSSDGKLQCRYPIFETHCHLDYLKDSSIEEVVNACSDIGVERIVTISVDPSNQDKVCEIAERHPLVYCTQGVHPHNANMWTPEVKSNITENCKNFKVMAIGEIGLDYHYDHSPRDVQRSVFEEQLQLAQDLNLPVVIHTRESDLDTLTILKNFSHLRGVFHCFTSGRDLAEWAIDQGFYLGFNGILTFSAADNVRDILRITPKDKIVLETDAPYLAPIPFRGRKNTPLYLPFIAGKILETRKEPAEVMLPLIFKNSLQLFEL